MGFYIRLVGYDTIVETHDAPEIAIQRCKELRRIYIASDYYVEDGHGYKVFPKVILSSEITPFRTRYETYG